VKPNATEKDPWAADWAKRNPAVDWGSIEIRPVARTYTGERGEWYTP